MPALGPQLRRQLGTTLSAAIVLIAVRGSTEPLPSTGSYVLWVSASPEAKDCPSAPELRQRIGARLGQDPFVDYAEPGNTIHVSFAHVGPTYHARLSLRNVGSEAALDRHFEDRAESCLQVAEALVLGTTLLLEGGSELMAAEAAAVAQPARTSSKSTVTPPKPPRDEVAPPQAQSENEAARSIRDSGSRPSIFGELRLGPMLSSGVVSSEGVGWGAGISGQFFALGGFGVKLAADYLIADSIQRGTTTYQFSQTAASIGAVVDGRLSERFRLVPEVGFMVGVIHAAVITRNPTDPGDYPFLGMRLGGAAELRLVGPLTLGLGGHVRMPFYRHVFRASGLAETVWTQPRLGFSAEVAIGLCFE